MNSIKQWIWNNHFEEDKEKLYRKAFSDASKDLEETNVYNTDEKAKVLAEKMLSDMIGFTDKNKIITYEKTKGLLFIGGEKQLPEQLFNLKQEAEIIYSSQLYGIIYNTIGELARQRIFVTSKDWQDVLAAKMALYNLDTMKTIIDILRSYEPKK